MVISIYVLLLSLLCKILEVRESNKELVSTITIWFFIKFLKRSRIYEGIISFKKIKEQKSWKELVGDEDP